MLKHKNVIITPVKRWFHLDKKIHDPVSVNFIVNMLKDPEGSDVIVLTGKVLRYIALCN